MKYGLTYPVGHTCIYPSIFTSHLIFHYMSLNQPKKNEKKADLVENLWRPSFLELPHVGYD